MENVAVVGASPNEERYSNKAMRMLEENGHHPIPVAPGRAEVLGRKAYPNLTAVPDRIDTVTMYIGPGHQAGVLDEVIRIKPPRIIFNPGAENPDRYDELTDQGIQVVEACTLVLLRTNQF